MTDDRTTTTGTQPTTTIIERRGSGAGLLVGLAVLVLVIVGAIYLVNQNNREQAKTDAVTQAADSVGDAAKDVGDAAKDATDGK